MLKQSQTFLVIFASLIFSYGCKQDRAIQGFEFTDQEDLGQVKRMTIRSKDLEVSFGDTVTATGTSGLLWLGSLDHLRSKILMRWENLGLVENEVLEATILLTARTVIGARDSKRTFTATVHRVTGDWDEETVTSESLGNTFELTSIGSGQVLSITQMSEGDTLLPEVTRIPLTSEGVELVNVWRDTAGAEDERGVIIDFATADFIKGLEGRSAVNRPRLEMIVALNEADRDTLLFAPSGDSYLVERTAMLPPGPLYVDHVLSHHSVVKFTLDSIPRESIVNQAIMRFDVDLEKSVLTDTPFQLQIIRLAEEFQAPTGFEIDSTFSPLNVNLDPTASSLVVSARNLVQDWISTAAPNHGILLRTGAPGADVSRLAFFPSQFDSTKSPTLQVDLSIAPTGTESADENAN